MDFGQFFKQIIGSKSSDSSEQDNAFFDAIIENYRLEIKHNNDWFNSIKPNEVKTYNEQVLGLSGKEKIAFLVYELNKVSAYYNSENSYSSTDFGYHKVIIALSIINQLYKTKSDFDDKDIEQLIRSAVIYNSKNGYPIKLPIKNILNQIEKKQENGALPANLQSALKQLYDKLKTGDTYPEKDNLKLVEQINNILHPRSAELTNAQLILFSGTDDFSIYANDELNSLAEREKPIWNELIFLVKKSGGAKPSKKYLEDGKEIIRRFGYDHFKNIVHSWLSFLVKHKTKEIRKPAYIGDKSYLLLTHEFVSSATAEYLKGIIWLCATMEDKETLNLLAGLADRAYKKIPGQGQTSTIIGNACACTLYKSGSLDGINHLSRLKLRIKLPSTQQLIERYLTLAAEDRGMPVGEIEDLSVDDFELINGERIFKIADYKAVVNIEKVGKVILKWFNSDDKEQKSDPQSIKDQHPGELKKIKNISKQIEGALSTQRDRLDGSFKMGRVFTFDHFNTYYFSHGLVSWLAKRLIWKFIDSGEITAAFWFDGCWVDQNKKIFTPGSSSKVSLWHPSESSLENVRQWRTFLVEKQIQQPIKQAFREIYLLTDAEINTRNYSNRMAGHLLKQYQFISLAKLRDWQYTIQGQFDNGADGVARIKLLGYRMAAEYWTNAVNAVGEVNASSIFNYVATDQVRFFSEERKEYMDLIDVPVQVFSEVMRDVDLFVGVSSVGNDPMWRDNGGLLSYRDYWQVYSFGDLTEVAKSRREILERLIPRLKIKDVAMIKDRFLIIKGKKRTYKIHLGSTNILMEPNDQYLCIVPDRSQKNIAENVFLPFEGDTGLSIILSKAFLLAEDDKITDSTITRQINTK